MSDIVWCHLPERDRERTANLLKRNNPDQGVISVVGIVGRQQNSGWFARDLLVAFGKPSYLHGNAASCIDPWTILPMWFASAGIHTLIVVDAQRLGRGRTADLISLACETDLNLWLITHDPLEREPWLSGLEDWPVTEMDWQAAEPKLPRTHEITTPVASTAPPFTLLELPASDMWTFRANTKQSLPPALFAAVDKLLVASTLETAAWAAEPRDRKDIEARIISIVHEFPTAGERLVVLRGLQIAMLRNGWHIGVGYDGFDAFAGEHPGRLVFDEDERWERLSRWWQPHRGAVSVLTAMGLTPEEILGLELTAVRDTTVETPSGSVTTPKPARKILAAQLVSRLAEGAQQHDPLISINEATDGVAWVRDIVKAAAAAGAAVPIPGPTARKQWPNSTHLRKRLGIRFNALPDGGLDGPINPESFHTDEEAVLHPNHEPPVIAGDFISSRRLEMGITRRGISRQVGISDSSVMTLENGDLPALLKAKDLLLHAKALGLHPSELFGGRGPAEEEAEPDSDAAHLGSLLFECSQSVQRTALTDILGWDTARLDDAAHSLDRNLRPAGMRLLISPGELTLVTEASALPPPAQIAAVIRRQHLRATVGHHRVKLLVLIENRTFRGTRNVNHATRSHLEFLRRAGLIEQLPGRTLPTMAPDVRYSLMLPPQQNPPSDT